MRLSRAAAVLLLLTTAAVYFPTGEFGFVSYDDPQYVSQNERVEGGLSVEGLRWALTSEHHGNWHPVTTLSLMIGSELGFGPGARHAVNVALHLANTLLLFWLLLRATGARWCSLAVAALFALHPLHVEPVAWISSRKDVLCAASGLASLLAYVDWVRTWRRSSYFAALALFSLGLASKPMLVTWPFVLLLLDVWPLRRFGDLTSQEESWRSTLRSALLEKLPFFALTFASIPLTMWAQREGGALRDTPLFPFGDRVANAVSSYGEYLSRTLWPVDLAVLYPFPLEPQVTTAIVSGVALAGITLACIATRRTHPFLLFGWLWYLGTLVPVIGLVQVGVQASADRYTYLPLVGIFVAVVWGVASLVEKRPVARAAAVCVGIAALLVLAVLSAQQVRVWRSSLTLYEHGLRVTERNAVLANNLGIALADQGRNAEAVAAYERGLGFPSPVALIIDYNLGISLARIGRHHDAIDHFDAALRADQENAEALYHRGRSLAKLGRLEEARRDLERVVDLEPTAADPHVELALVLGKLGDLEEATAQLARAIELRPTDLDARINLAVAYMKQGSPSKAVAELERVLALQPGHEAAARYLEQARAMQRGALNR